MAVSDALFRSQRIFASLGEDDLSAIARLARSRKIAAGTVVFQRGDAGREMFLLSAGRLRLSVLSAEGRELSIRIAEAGSLIGEMAVLDGGPRSTDATAVTDVEAEVIAKADLDRLMLARPAIAQAFIAFLCGRLRDTTEQLETIALYRLEARLARFILGLIRQKDPDREMSGSVRFDFPFSQTEVADVIGASRPKVNKAFTDLEADGAIVREGGVLLCRIGRLQALAEGDGA